MINIFGKINMLLILLKNSLNASDLMLVDDTIHLLVDDTIHLSEDILNNRP